MDTPDQLSNRYNGEGDSDPNIYQAGLAISSGGFTVAGGWTRVDHGLLLDNGGLAQRTDGHAWTIGAGYTTGPWAFSAGYLHGEEEGATDNPGHDENDFYQVSASYALSPGLGVNLQYLHIDREADQEGCDGCGADSDTDAVMLGVKVGF